GAELLGVADRTGSIEPGKIANLTVVKGDLFGSDRAIKNVFVDGKPFEQKDVPPAERGQGGRRGGRPEGTAPGATPAIMEVGGNFTINIDIPGQPMQGTLVLVQQSAVITGTLTTQLGTTNVRNGKVSADGFTFASTVEVGGASMEINVTGKVTGNQISGTIDSPQGAFPFSGTKNP
ncbi:MAG TPA: amidohydrolase family protein, partial [Pyrinomonadaceae bacterium]|nr:amidohydrolase family protein [Pyrinomonadaceae bacterium]